MNPKRFFFIILFALAVILSQAPLYAATHIVTNCSNEGTGSLRQAILDAQDGDEIVFNITVQEAGYAKKITDLNGYGLVTNEVAGASWFRILLQTDIAINNKNNISIKGSTQPNTESNNPYGPRIEIVRNSFYSPYSAFNLSSSSNCTIEGFAIGGFYNSNIAGAPAAIKITGGGYNHIYGCYLGVTASGEGTLQSYVSTSYKSNYYGLYISQSIYNTIGGDTVSQRNIISGNQNSGIFITTNSTSNEIKGNYIGTNYWGEKSLKNGSSGISISANSYFTLIKGNLISGNSSNGISVNLVDTTYLLNNIIGLSASQTSAIPNSYGISIQGSSTTGRYCVIKNNTVSGNTSYGIQLYRCSTVEVKGNFIGTDSSGNTPFPNGSGLYLNGTQYSTIGGTTPEDKNIISGNSNFGIVLGETNCNSNEVLGNYIGVNKNGDTAIPNGNKGIFFSTYFPKNNIIKGNIISGNLQEGIRVYQASYNIFSENYIGTDKNGTTAIPNGMQGISIAGNNISLGKSNTIEGNIISGNLQEGIYLNAAPSNFIYGNYIGIDKSGSLNLANGYSGIYSTGQLNIIGPNNTIAYNGSRDGDYGIAIDTAFYNTIKENSLFLNYDKGIALINNGNAGIAYPEITSSKYYSSTSTTIVQGTAPANSTIEVFFTEAVPDLSGQGEGKIYLGKTTSDVNGNWSIELSNPSLNVGSNLCATATSSNGNTSEFSINKETILYVPAGEDTTPPSISISNPNSVTKVKGGDSSNITFIIEDASGIENGTAGFYYKIGRGEYILINLYYSLNEGADWTPMPSGTGISNTGSLSWAVPDVETNEAKVKIEAIDNVGNINTEESSNFTIKSNIAPLVQILSPLSSAKWKGGTVQSITYTAQDSSGLKLNSASIYYSTGETWIQIATNQPVFSATNTSYSWTIPIISTLEAKIRVTVEDIYGNLGIGETPSFIIDSQVPSINIITPTSQTLWKGGVAENHYIEWISSDNFALAANSTNIYYSLDGGNTYLQIDSNISNTESYNWIFGSITTTEARIKIDVKDEVGNIGTKESDKFIIDSQPPAVPFLRSPENNSFTRNNLTTLSWDPPIIWDVSGIKTYDIFLNQLLVATVNGDTTDFTFSLPLSDGVYSWEIRATDGAGNIGGLSDKWVFTIDTIVEPPSLKFPPNGSRFNTIPTLSWDEVSDPSGIENYEVKIKGLSFFTVNNTPDFVPSINSDGVYTWSVSAIDKAGNQSVFSTFWTFTYDQTSPQTIINNPTANSVFAGNQAYKIEWITTDNISNPENIGINIYITYNDGQSWTKINNDTENNDGLFAWATPLGISTDKARVRIDATDETFNISTREGENFIIDSEAPIITLKAPIDGILTNNNMPTFQWNAASDAFSEISQYGLIIDLKLVATINSGTTSYILPTAINDGNYKWAVNASDSVGNVGTSEEWSLMIDSTPPFMPNLIYPTNNQIISSAPKLSWSGATDNLSGIASYEVSINGSLVILGNTTDYQSTLSDGSYTWKVRAKDRAGNWGNYSSLWTFTIDGTPPDITGITLKDKTTGNTQYSNELTVSVEANGVAGDPVYMKMARTDAELIAAAWIPYSQNFKYTFSTGDGTKTLLYKLKDAASNESNTVQDSIIVDTTPPTIVIYNPILNEEITGGTDYQIKWQANDEIFNNSASLAVNVYYSLNNGINWISLLRSDTNDNMFSWNPVPNQETTTAKIRIEAIDGMQNMATAESGNFTIKKDEGYVPSGPLTISIVKGPEGT